MRISLVLILIRNNLLVIMGGFTYFIEKSIKNMEVFHNNPLP